MYHCLRCGRVFKSRTGVIVHLLREHGESKLTVDYLYQHFQVRRWAK